MVVQVPIGPLYMWCVFSPFLPWKPRVFWGKPENSLVSPTCFGWLHTLCCPRWKWVDSVLGCLGTKQVRWLMYRSPLWMCTLSANSMLWICQGRICSKGLRWRNPGLLLFCLSMSFDDRLVSQVANQTVNNDQLLERKAWPLVRVTS